MRQSVIDKWHEYSTPLEGRVPSMYLDILGLVTCGVGNLIDPMSAALELPWKRDSDGQRAAPDEVRAAWTLLKSRPDYARRSTAAARALTKLHLDDADIDALVSRKLSDNQAYIRQHHFPMFEDFPADAQLGILSMAWAVGPGFPTKFPSFTRSVLAGDWLGARDNCTIREAGNPGVVPRNRANRVCFTNAEIVARCGMDRSELHWPTIAQADNPATERPANLGDLVVTGLEDARLHAELVAQLGERRAEILMPDTHDLDEEEEEVTVVDGPRRA